MQPAAPTLGETTLLKNGIKEISDRPLKGFHYPVFPFSVSVQLLLLSLLQLSSPRLLWQGGESSVFREALLLHRRSAKGGERFTWLP